MNSFKKRTEKQQKGDFGERIAKCFLLFKNLNFINQNFHSRFGELDLIFEDQSSKYLVFVEVRLKKYKSMVTPIESISLSKQQKIYYTVENFLLQNPVFNMHQIRIDIIAIYSDIDLKTIEFLMQQNDNYFCNQIKFLKNIQINWIKNAIELHD